MLVLCAGLAWNASAWAQAPTKSGAMSTGIEAPGKNFTPAPETSTEAKTCDPDYMTAMKARAWMGGKRDMEMAVAFISMREHEESILNMSCYEKYLVDLAEQDNKLFSDAVTRWAGISGPATLFRNPVLCYGGGCPCSDVFWCDGLYHSPNGTGLSVRSPRGPNPPGTFNNKNMDRAFTELIRRPLKEHWFNYYYPIKPKQPPEILCLHMGSLWGNAKCRDFRQGDWVPPFQTLEEQVCRDPRGCMICDDRRKGKWGKAFKAAYPEPVPLPPASEPDPPGGVDETLGYTEIIDGKSCSAVQPILTGVKRGDGKDDAFCPGVGCSYSAASGSCTAN